MNTKTQANSEDVQPNERRPAPKGRGDVPQIRNTFRSRHIFSPYPTHLPTQRNNHEDATSGNYLAGDGSGPSRSSWIWEANSKLRKEQMGDKRRENRRKRREGKSKRQELHTLSIDLPDHCRAGAYNSKELRRLFIQNFIEGIMDHVSAKISSHSVQGSVLSVHYYLLNEGIEINAANHADPNHLQEVIEQTTEDRPLPRCVQAEQSNYDMETETSNDEANQSGSSSNVDLQTPSRFRSRSDIPFSNTNEVRDVEDDRLETAVRYVGLAQSSGLVHRNFRSGTILLEPDIVEKDLLIDLDGKGSILPKDIHESRSKRSSSPSGCDSLKKGAKRERPESEEYEEWEEETVERYEKLEDLMNIRIKRKVETEVDEKVDLEQKDNLEAKSYERGDVEDVETKRPDSPSPSPSSHQARAQDSQDLMYRSRGPGFEKTVMIRIPRDSQQEKLRRIVLSSTLQMSFVVTSNGFLHEITRSLPRRQREILTLGTSSKDLVEDVCMLSGPYDHIVVIAQLRDDLSMSVLDLSADFEHPRSVSLHRSYANYGRHTRGASAVVAVPKSRIFAAGGHDNSIRLWELNEELCFAQQKLLNVVHSSLIHSLLCIENPSPLLLSASADGCVNIWDMSAETSVNRMRTSSPVYQLHSTPARETVLLEVGHREEQFEIHDYRAFLGRPAQRFGYFSSQLHGRHVRGDLWGNVFACGTKNGAIKFWDLRNLRTNYQELSFFPGQKIMQVVFDGNDMVVASENSRLSFCTELVL